jgi:crossover junction endodeoxyribonuclease RuvC
MEYIFKGATMRLTGIDPGKGGSMYLIVDGVPTEFYDMPMNEKGKIISPKHIVENLKRWAPDVVVVEKVNAGPRMATSAAYNFGANSFGPICICAGMGIRCRTIIPQKWKAYHGLLGKEKETSRQLALKKYPQLADILKRKKDTDRAEAILMATAWEAMNK